MTYAEAVQELVDNYGYKLQDSARLMEAAKRRSVAAETVVERLHSLLYYENYGRRAAFARLQQELATGMLVE